jgi:hypothetical protein
MGVIDSRRRGKGGNDDGKELTRERRKLAGNGVDLLDNGHDIVFESVLANGLLVGRPEDTQLLV